MMRAGFTLVCLMAVLAVSSARPQGFGFGRFGGSGGFGSGTAGGAGNVQTFPGGSNLNLGANANTNIDSTNGFAAASSIGSANGFALTSPFGSSSNLNTNANNFSQG